MTGVARGGKGDRPLRFSVRGRGERNETQGMRWQSYEHSLLSSQCIPLAHLRSAKGGFAPPLWIPTFVGMTWLCRRFNWRFDSRRSSWSR